MSYSVWMSYYPTLLFRFRSSEVLFKGARVQLWAFTTVPFIRKHPKLWLRSELDKKIFGKNFQIVTNYALVFPLYSVLKVPALSIKLSLSLSLPPSATRVGIILEFKTTYPRKYSILYPNFNNTGGENAQKSGIFSKLTSEQLKMTQHLFFY